MNLCVFCGFVSGEIKSHTNDIQFKPIHETKNTLSFLSIDFIAHEDGHTLVIPKKHYKNLEDIPNQILAEMMEHIKLIVKAIKKDHKGYNILLNNGKHAGQYIMHAHFHIIPRDKSDNIKIEKWKHQTVSSKEYERIRNRIINNMNK